MKRFLAIAIITVGTSFTISAQEHTSRPPSTPSNTPVRTNTPARTTPVDNSGWVQFNSEEGRFSVLVPEIPEEKSETKNSSPGPYTTHMFVAKDMNNVYLVGWVDYDSRFNFNRQAELEANRDNFVRGLKARLMTTRPTIIDGYSAIEFTAETGDRIFTSRVFIVGRRPYQIVIGTPKGINHSAYVNRFFNSFKVNLP